MNSIKILHRPTFVLFVGFLFINYSFGFQKNDQIRKSYDEILCNPSKSTTNSLAQIKQFAESGNPNWFLRIGYFVDANNIMYKATKDSKYLKINADILGIIDSQGEKLSVGKKWIAKIGQDDINKDVDNQEFMLYEGYLLRYAAELVYLVKKNGLISQISNYNTCLNFVEGNFKKWRSRSLDGGFKDESMFYGIRVHMGAQWATTALFLSSITESSADLSIYNSFLKSFDKEFRRGLRSRGIFESRRQYVWNATWRQAFSEQLRRRVQSLGFETEIQDVAHGNHIVQYVLSSYELGFKSWTLKDITRFANTLKYRIWTPSTRSFADNVDGSTSVHKSIRGTGWRQSDGWMKLMVYDKDLYAIYKKFYYSNENVQKSYLNLQFLSNFMYFNSVNEG